MSNRAPTFDMDLSDLMDGDQPISYEKAKLFFAQDPSQKYVTLSTHVSFGSFNSSVSNEVYVIGGQHILQAAFLFL